MKALILAAGYATRLYPLTLDTPKALLKIGHKPIIDYMLHRLDGLEDIDKIFIVSNDKFYKQFDDWLTTKQQNGTTKIRLISDGTFLPEDRIGAIGDINLAINQELIDDDLLIIAGDNLFDFDLREFLKFALQRKPYHSICLYLGDNHLDLSRFGIVQLSGDSEISNFEEKPDNPKSNLIATCIYFLPNQKLYLIKEYISQGNHNDNPGSYIRWLTQNDRVYGNIFDGIWFDLGDFDSISDAVIQLNGKQMITL